MKRLVALLSLTTVLFAASTVHLALELRRREPPAAQDVQTTSARERGSIGETLVSDAAAGSPVLESRAAAPSDAGDFAGPAPSGPRDDEGSSTSGADPDPSVSFARQFRARYEDSAQRGILLDEARTGVRRQFGRLKTQLGLSDRTFDQLVTMIAERNLAEQARWARCVTTPGCDLEDPSRAPPPVDAQEQELLALLGADGAQAFNHYRDSLGERDSIAQFRGRLSDASFLPEAQAEQLIAALAAERRRYSEELAQQGQRLSGWGTNLGMLWFPEGIGSIEMRLAEAAQYSARMRARASQLLTPEQLAVYVQMQEELLAQMAAYMRPPPRKANPMKLARG